MADFADTYPTTNHLITDYLITGQLKTMCLPHIPDGIILGIRVSLVRTIPVYFFANPSYT
jgi:hypothetical protein